MGGFGALGGILKATQGDPKVRTLANVKNADIAKRIATGLSDYDAARTTSQGATSNFLEQFNALTPAAQAAAAQESDVVSSIYDNRVADQLAALRRQRFGAQQKAVDLALADARQRTNAARILSGSGDSSYARRLGLDLANRVNAQALLSDADQERADFSSLLQNRLGLAGRRTAMGDAVAERALRPAGLARANQSADLAALGALTQLDQANTFYGLQQQRSGLDRWAEGLNAVGQGLMTDFGLAVDAAGAVGGLMSGGMLGGGGGGPKPASGPNPTGSFGFNPTPAPSFNPGLANPSTLGGYSFGGLGGAYNSNYGF